MAHYNETSTPIVRIDSFYDGRVIDSHRLRRIELTSSEIALYGLRADDILINRVNSIDYVGKSAIVESLEEPTIFESNIIRCRMNGHRLRPEFVILWLCSHQAIRYFRSMAKNAVAQASINQEDVRGLGIPLLSAREQASIIERTYISDSHILAAAKERAKLEMTKSGLMHDLLTGRVRVPESMLKRVAATT